MTKPRQRRSYLWTRMRSASTSSRMGLPYVAGVLEPEIPETRTRGSRRMPEIKESIQ